MQSLKDLTLTVTEKGLIKGLLFFKGGNIFLEYVQKFLKKQKSNFFMILSTIVTILQPNQTEQF